MNDKAELLDLPVASLGPMNTRLYNCLTKTQYGNAFTSVRQIVAQTEKQVRSTPGLGETMMAELKRILAERGLEFARAPDRGGTLPLPFPPMHSRLERIEARLDALEAMWPNREAEKDDDPM